MWGFADLARQAEEAAAAAAAAAQSASTTSTSSWVRIPHTKNTEENHRDLSPCKMPPPEKYI